MSPINFENLASQHPKYKRALHELASWMNSHRGVRIISPITLAKELRGIDPVVLAEVLTLLVQAGYLRRVYKVVTPSGVLSDGEFDDPTAIPERLPDRFEHYFDTTDADVVPFFRPVA